MKECRNCLNCGAPLHYDETNYGSVAKCGYCRTEYHIDKLGRVEEYKVKLRIFNRIVSFYIGQVEFKPVAVDTWRTLDGQLHTTIARPSMPEMELNLISYDVEEIKEG